MSISPLMPDEKPAPSVLGLAELQISGSGQFSEKSLKTLFKTIPSWNITIVDLREESHGFVNGHAFSWYNFKNSLNDGLADEEILVTQKNKLEELSKKRAVLLYKKKGIPFPLFVKKIDEEEDLASKYGMNYVRLPVRDHMKPDDARVDAFLAFVKSVDPETWLHFHCSAGRGRSTTYMTMYDMIHNATRVSLEDIVRRQHLINGLDLFFASPDDGWKYPHALERGEFIKQFYHYCLENPTLEKSWTEWLQTKSKL